MDDVITMLEVRRRFEIPSSHSAPLVRGRLQLTAQRMIARRKIA